MNLVGGLLLFPLSVFKTFTVVLLIAQHVFTGKVCKTFTTVTAAHDSRWHALYANENRITLHTGWCMTTLCNTQSLPFHHSRVRKEVDMKR